MSENNSTGHPYDALRPEVILDAIEAFGLRCDGRILALNSYENRVYQIGIDEATPVVAKFYRPRRWTDEAILEEHRFTTELAANEIPVVAPLTNAEGQTLVYHEGFRYAVYPRRGGHWPELSQPETLTRLGYFIGRIHAVGSERRFRHRPTLSVKDYGHASLATLRDGDFIPAAWRNRYLDVGANALTQVEQAFAAFDAREFFAIHGDCHPGNVLWTEGGAHFVDFDDCVNGPAIQDIWMLLSGDGDEMAYQLSQILYGYESFQRLDRREIALIEPLRTLRLIHYAAWLAKRWDDPAFPANFPWFTAPHYWQEQIQTLEQQLQRMDSPPLTPEHLAYH